MFRNSVLGIGLAVATLLAVQVGGCGGGGGGGGGAGTNGGGTAGTNGGGTAGTNGGGTAGTNGGGTAGTNGGDTAGTNGGGTAGTTGGGTAGTTGGGTAGTTGGGTAGTTGGGTAGTTGGGTAGTTGAGGGTGGANAACPASITDNSTTCTMASLVCPKTCGVETKGTKSCTCNGTVFMCETVAPTCHYPAGTDLTCYHLPTPVPACPAGTVNNGTCTDAACMPCSGYADSSGAAKTGYCVCVAGKYKCASDKEWPAQ